MSDTDDRCLDIRPCRYNAILNRVVPVRRWYTSCSHPDVGLASTYS